MTENIQSRNEALEKVEGIQFLRVNEVLLLRAVHRVFVDRRKNFYRRDILTHITEESANSALAAFTQACRVTTVVHNNLKVMHDLSIVTKIGERTKFPQYRQKSEALEHTVRRNLIASPLFYEFDAVIVRDILKLLKEIEYIPLNKWLRSVVGILHRTPKETWWQTRDVQRSDKDGEYMTKRLISNPDDEIFKRLVEIDKTSNAFKYRTTNFGLKVIDVWNQVTQLIEKHNEAQAEYRSRETATTEETA